MGLDIYLHDRGRNLHFGEDENGKIPEKWYEQDRSQAKSQKYSDHYCERTYLRSSYNGSGFDRVVGNLIGESFYTIFGPEIPDGALNPDYPDEPDYYVDKRIPTVEGRKELLRKALVRAREVTAKLKAVEMPLSAMAIDAEGFEPPVDEEEAIKKVTEEYKRHQEHLAQHPDRKDWIGGWYSNRSGHYFFGDKQLEVIAAFPTVDILGRRAVMLVSKRDITWYIQAAEITEEFIEYALTLDDPRISWSG